MTAVEWLIKKIELTDFWQEEIQQALEMEKQQQIDFANNYGFDICGYDYEKAEQYYNETYKKDNL